MKETIEAKLKHLGSSIDHVREDVREVKEDVKELRIEGNKRSEALASVSKDLATQAIQVETNKNNIRDNKVLIWKILAILAGAGFAADKILN